MLRHPGEIWRMALPDGKEERIQGDFSGVQYGYQINLSWDGKEILIVQPRFQQNVVMIENLFK
jgi:hypothetical protein